LERRSADERVNNLFTFFQKKEKKENKKKNKKQKKRHVSLRWRIICFLFIQLAAGLTIISTTAAHFSFFASFEQGRAFFFSSQFLLC
jgi:hypothetical protein